MDNKELTARLKAFALMMRFGHDLFQANDFSDAAALAVNNSRVLLNFKSSSLIEVSGGRAEIVAQYAQVEPNRHSKLAELQCLLCAKLPPSAEPRVLTVASCKELSLPPEIPNELLAGGNACLVVPLQPPPSVPKHDFRLLWLIEFGGEEVPAYAQTSAKLLAPSIAEALFFRRFCTRVAVWRRRGGRRLVWILLALLLAGTMFLRVPESTTAEFELRAPEITAVYAWFDGPVAACLVQDGAAVKKGDVIAEYDTAQLKFRLASAENAVREIQAELELESRTAFTDRERLGKLKLLEARLNAAKVAVDEARWYLAHSKLTAPAGGVLVLADGRAEQLSGKAVRTGDRLFEIYGGRGMIAEIPVNERDASILERVPAATLFLHTAPEQPIPARITEISRYPELTEQRTYCYRVRAELPPEAGSLRYGMRGIARLSGERVSLGYYLFKSVVLYFRGL